MDIKLSEKEVCLIVKLYHTHLSIGGKYNNKKRFIFKKNKKIYDIGSLPDFGKEIIGQYRNAYDFLKKMIEIEVLVKYDIFGGIVYYKLDKDKIHDILYNISGDNLFEDVWNLISDYHAIIKFK